ncbi:hypothetical protein IQ07DRAFT_390627 [Pyrenochaeta sp. DS3sAY3a]|nr:hypothetical protein IQ07DRAFT_390627 [Pyrenochaeta sp. DS3sAY3a]
MPKYTPWTWSAPHGRHYSYLIADDGTTVLDTLWAGPSAASAASTTETTSDSTPRSQTSARYSKGSASSSHGSSLGANYTYAKQDPSGSTHEEEDEEEDVDEGDDDAEEEEEEEDPAAAAQAAAVAARPDSGVASYIQQQAAYASAYGRTQQPSVSSTSQYSKYQYATTQYGASSAYQTQYSTNNQYQSPRNAMSTLPLDVQATIGYKDRRFIQTGADRNETEQLDTRKTPKCQK